MCIYHRGETAEMNQFTKRHLVCFQTNITVKICNITLKKHADNRQTSSFIPMGNNNREIHKIINEYL